MAFGVCFGRGMENLRAPRTGLGVVSRLGWYDGKQTNILEFVVSFSFGGGRELEIITFLI